MTKRKAGSSSPATDTAPTAAGTKPTGKATSTKLTAPSSISGGRVEMHPRERMTVKARAAIEAYARARAGEADSYGFAGKLIQAVIDAERMPRERLYGWLEERGLQWRPGLGRWNLRVDPALEDVAQLLETALTRKRSS